VAKIRVQQYGSNKTFWIETDPVLATKAVLGKNLFFQDPNTGDHVLLQQQDILNAGTVQALAGTSLVQADNPGSKIGSTTATSPTGKGTGAIGSGTTLVGDVSSSITGPGTFTVTVTGIKGHVISAAPSVSGQILIYNTAGAGTWAPLTISGDATMTAAGALTIAASAITLAKMANVATSTVFYRKTAGTGAPEVNTLATLKTDLGLTGTNSGDVTLAAVGSTPNANGASFSAQVLTLQPANTSFPGVLLAADWTTFNNKAPLASPAFTGTPTAPTAGVGTNTTQLATCAFVLANAGGSNKAFLGDKQTTVQAGDTINNTTSLTAFASTISALAALSTFNPGTLIVIKAGGVVSSSGTPTIILRSTFGGTTLFNTSSSTINGATNVPWTLEVSIKVLSSTTIEYTAIFSYQSATANVTSNIMAASSAAVTVSSSVFSLSVVWSVAAVANTITLRQLSALVYPA